MFFFFFQLDEFINIVNGSNSLYGLKNETLDSLLLSLLPPYGHTYQDTPPDAPVGGDNVDLYLLQELLRSLRNSAGFAVPVVSIQSTFTCTHFNVGFF